MEKRPSNIASDKVEMDTPNIRKSRLQSWLGESATPGEGEDANGPDSKELSGLALDSIQSGDQEESKAGIPYDINA